MNTLVLIVGILLLLAACGERDDMPTDADGRRGSGGSATRLDPEALRAAVEEAGIDARGMGVWRRTPELTIYAVPVKARDAVDRWTRAREHMETWELLSRHR